MPEPPLYPESCRNLAAKHSKLVDATPHAGRKMKMNKNRCFVESYRYEINLFPGLLYGGDPDNDTRPAFLQRLASGMVKDQVSWNIRGHHGTKGQI